MVKDIKSNLTNIVVIIGLIGSIGAGFIKYGEIMTKIDVLTNASKTVDISYASEIAVLEEKVKALEESNTGEIDESLSRIDIKASINSKEIELLKVQLKELKISTSNPLSN
jgi:hypothetical protein